MWTACSHSPSHLCLPPPLKDVSPLTRAGFFSYWTYHWVTPLIRKGYSKELSLPDLYQLPESMTTENTLHAFNLEWAKELKRKGPREASIVMAFVRAYIYMILLTMFEVTAFVAVSIVVAPII
jgi:hypothetical protein